KTANYVRNICGLIGNGATFLRSGAAAISGAVDVVQHYIETGDVDWAGIGAVGLNMFAAKSSASAVLSNGNSLRKMLSEDNVAGKIKKSFGNLARKVKSKTARGAGANNITSSSRVWDYSEYFEKELANFNSGYQINTVIDEDLYLVQFHSSAEVGNGRSLKFWTTTDEANSISTIDDYMDKMALLSDWGDRDYVSIAKVPSGTRVKFAIGTAKEQTSVIESRKGGGVQLLFEEFDESWIIDTRHMN
ncbi:MAG: hypothetical protein IJC76_02575, partial [Lachnospiraceae bacterium]|nr:hypothetical protein [Lachnospiraceae bacterium]